MLFYAIIFIEISEHAPFNNTFLPALNYCFFPFLGGIIHYKLILPIIAHKKKKVFIALSPLVITLSVTLYYIFDFQIPYSYVNTEEYGFKASEILYVFIMWILISTLCSTMFFLENWVKNDYIKTELANEKLKAELNFLRAQINPHFLFNTLDSIRAHAQMGSDKTGSLLEKLSSILRFMVYDCEQDKVSLDQEISAISNLVDIIMLKDENEKAITFTHTGVLPHHKIAPLILINIVENIFKHCDINSNKNAFIEVKLSVNDANNCTFETINYFSKKNPTDTNYSGIEMENIIKRLNLIYPEKHNLNFYYQESVFYTKLNMTIENEI